MSTSLRTKVPGHSTALGAETLVQNCSRRTGSWGRREQKADGPVFFSSASSLVTCAACDTWGQQPVPSSGHPFPEQAGADHFCQPRCLPFTTSGSLPDTGMLPGDFPTSERRPAGAQLCEIKMQRADLLQSRSEGLHTLWRTKSKKKVPEN